LSSASPLQSASAASLGVAYVSLATDLRSRRVRPVSVLGKPTALLATEVRGGEQRHDAIGHVSTTLLPTPPRINVAAAQSGTQHTEAGTKEKLAPKSWFAITFSFAFVIKALCMLSNVAFQVSPLPQVRKFTKEQDTGEADAAPFVSILYGGCQWCFYGIFAYEYTQKSGFLVLVYSNFMGVFLGVYYIWIFQSNCQSTTILSKLLMYYRGVGLMVGIQIIAISVMSRQQALYFCGLVSSTCSVLGSCSLLSTLPDVLRERCSASINLPLLMAGMTGTVLWIICGFILWDFLIVVPNVMGIMIQSICLSLVLYFPREPSIGSGTESPRDRYLLTANHARSVRGRSGPDYGTLKVCGETGGTW